MAVKKYKLAIMGASGVGKTVFLGSYFYATVHRGMQKKYPVTLSEGAVKHEQALVGQLFKGSQVGTDKRIDMGFNVNNKMEVQLFDLPGGDTTDPERWANGVKEDLENADGVLFFISADDVLHNYADFSNSVAPFSHAIQKIRAPKEGQEARMDVPIYFVFTKGDLIRNEKDENGEPYTAEKLWKVAGEGLRNTTTSGNSWLYSKGKYDKSFLTTALGDWLDANTPPKQTDYRPINVVEPMEQMYHDMVESKNKHRGIIALLTGGKGVLAAALLVALALGLTWGWQKIKWNSAVDSAKLAVSRQDYKTAIKVYDDYRGSGRLLGFGLGPLDPGSNVNESIEKLWVEYEATSFANLSGYLSVVNMNALPDANADSFQKGAEAISTYLRNDAFAAISPEHYGKVRAAEPYYSMGTILTQKIESFDDIQNVISRIDMMPSNWRDPLTNRIQLGLHTWGVKVTEEANASEAPAEGIALLDKSLAQARALAEHPWLGAEIKENSLAKLLEDWNKQKDALWGKLIEVKMSEVRGYDPADAVKELDELKNTPSLPQERFAQLEEMLASQYEALVRSWINSKNSAADVRAALANYPNMTHVARENAYAYIQKLDGIQLNDQKRRIQTAADLDTLQDNWKSVNELFTGNENAMSELRSDLQQRFDALLTAELDRAGNDISARTSGRDYEAAKSLIDSKANEIETLAGGLGSDVDFATARDRVNSWRRGIADRVADEEYTYLRSQFRGLETGAPGSGQIDPLLRRMGAFLSRWPQSAKAGEVREVREYLDQVKGGVYARLVIVDARVTKSYDTMGATDMYIKVKHDSHESSTGVFEDNDNPQFNFPINFTWTPSCGDFHFEAWDEDGMKDDRIGSASVSCGGVTGWKKLNGRISLGGGCTVNLRVENIPECRW